LIFLIAYAVLFAEIAVPAALIMTTLLVWTVYSCTTTPFPGLVSRITASLTTRIADIVGRRDGHDNESDLCEPCRYRNARPGRRDQA
jgi:hypothetical protein